jgi:hypothetical protein
LIRNVFQETYLVITSFKALVLKYATEVRQKDL